MEWIDQLKPLIGWLHVHPGWAGIITFLISLSESLAVLGLIIPGSIIMSAIGTLVGADIIPVIPTFLWGITGAFIGDLISYHVGWRFHQYIPDLWPFSRYPHWLMKAQDFFLRHGSKSVFLGRFIGPMRPITPIVAGMMKMSTWRFYLTSFIASTLWAPIYMLPGILIGAASQELQPETATRFLISVVVALIVLCLSMWLIKWLLTLFFRGVDHLMGLLWVRLKYKPLLSRFDRWLADPAEPEKHTQFMLFTGWVLLTLLAIVLVYSVLHHTGLFRLNHPIYELLFNIHQRLITQFFLSLSLFTTVHVLLAAWFISLWALIWQRQWQIAGHWLLCVVLVFGLASLSHLFIYYPHPNSIQAFSNGNSFPSIETALTIAVYGFLGVIITRPISLPLRRQLIYYALITGCTLLVFSRLYLVIHWLTDVIAGIILGAWVLLIISLSFRRHDIYPFSASPFVLLFFTTLVLCWSGQMVQNYQHYMRNMSPYWPTYALSETTWWDQSASNEPLYRTNRIGHPVKIMNIQWLGSLEQIKTTLETDGWHIQSKPGLISMINNLASHDQTTKTPVLQPRYLGENPQLVAVKTAKGLKQTVLLQLWNSKIALTDHEDTLWVGTLEYQSSHPHQFWARHQQEKKFLLLTSPMSFLSLPPLHYQTKLIYYPPDHRPPSIPGYEWNSGVLFIKNQPFSSTTSKD